MILGIVRLLCDFRETTQSLALIGQVDNSVSDQHARRLPSAHCHDNRSVHSRGTLCPRGGAAEVVKGRVLDLRGLAGVRAKESSDIRSVRPVRIG